jgi:hypothetical protein
MLEKILREESTEMQLGAKAVLVFPEIQSFEEASSFNQ